MQGRPVALPGAHFLLCDSTAHDPHPHARGRRRCHHRCSHPRYVLRYLRVGRVPVLHLSAGAAAHVLPCDSCGTLHHAVLTAADYGVPQRRRRAFFLATRLGFKFDSPKVTHLPLSQGQDLGLFEDKQHISVWEAIGDLPSLKHGETPEMVEYTAAPQNEFQAKMRNGLTSVSDHVSRKLAAIQFARLNSLEPGQGLKDLPLELQTKGGFSGAYGRLTKQMIAPTITRWVFHPGSGRWGHPIDIRTLSIREIARIQGFPDSFTFVGSFNDQSGQLGNAVPPLLAETVATHMLNEARRRTAATLGKPQSKSKIKPQVLPALESTN